ncbi:MAG TPA: acetyl-CoA carboxylase biotin carboxyl carrier protein subunit [Steroidobacter sp.]|uniref:acetyl-CoA carboxylase biotin carboxyl carrier protein subunit n=1 Tax=Steroidobacter sp. TaxID=1978227 RepID=UPI002ED9711F
MARVEVTASIAGIVLRLEAAEGAHVSEGEPILILESMKMEIPVEAPCAGRVVRLHVAVDGAVAEGDVVATVES